jgi:hypothetical protein
VFITKRNEKLFRGLTNLSSDNLATQSPVGAHRIGVGLCPTPLSENLAQKIVG